MIMKKFLTVMACVFGVATIILYIMSINKLDKDTARMLGTSATINIQATVFCAATAIMCVVNAVGAIIISALETQSYQAAKAVSNSAPSALEEEARARKVIADGGWKCPKCGSVNMSYVSSCGCGMTKRDALIKNQQGQA